MLFLLETLSLGARRSETQTSKVKPWEESPETCKQKVMEETIIIHRFGVDGQNQTLRDNGS